MEEHPSESTKPAVNPPLRRRLNKPLDQLGAATDRDVPAKPRRKSGFKKSDVWRAISAAIKGGVTVSGMELGRDGSFRLMFGGSHSDIHAPDGGLFDEWADRL